MLTSEHDSSNVARYRLLGEVDLLNASSVVLELERLVEATAADLVVDCTDLDFIDSSGVRALIEVNDQLRALGRAMTLVNMKPGSRRVFEVLGLQSTFGIADAHTRTNDTAADSARELDDQSAEDFEQRVRLFAENRATIEQAKGIIMATTRCSPDDAFALLRTQSQHENRKLRDVAAEIVATTTKPDSHRTRRLRPRLP